MIKIKDYITVENEKMDKIKKVVTEILDIIQDNNLTYKDTTKVLSSVSNVIDRMINDTIINSNHPKFREMVQIEVDKQILGYHLYQGLSTGN